MSTKVSAFVSPLRIIELRKRSRASGDSVANTCTVGSSAVRTSRSLRALQFLLSTTASFTPLNQFRFSFSPRIYANAMPDNNPKSSTKADLGSFEYEVFGRVQGVFFRAFTETKAKELGLVGYVRNTPHGTVQGEVQGPQSALAKMETWLTSIGSPASKIDRCQIKNRRSELSSLEYTHFSVRR